MGLLDYYKQFDDMSEEEISARLLAKRDAARWSERRRASHLGINRRLL